MKVLILGAGYAGINAYYELKKRGFEVNILSDTDRFVISSSWLRNNIFQRRSNYSFKLDFVKKAIIKEVDISSRTVYTNAGKCEAEKIVIALGAKRSGFDDFIKSLLKKDRVSLGAIYKYDEYIALQIAFYLASLHKKVSYSGSYLSWLGEKVERIIRIAAEMRGIKDSGNPEDLIPPPIPPEPFDSFIRADSNLSVSGSVYAAGDIVDLGPKLGELAMRMGIYVAKRIAGEESGPFSPIFINIIELGDKAVHIRSKYPWGSDYQSVKMSKLRLVAKRIIERYYMLRKGRMGFLVNL